MINVMVQITPKLSIRADQVESIWENSFGNTEIKMTGSSHEWRVSASVEDVTNKVNMALLSVRPTRF